MMPPTAGWQDAARAPEPEGAGTLAVPVTLRWAMGVAIAALIIAVPIVHYRAVYNHGRRLREVDAGVLYRSGCLTAEGFKDAVQRLHIRTIVNLQDEFPDPPIRSSYLDTSTVSEVNLCKEMGVRYVFIAPDLISRRKAGKERPRAIEDFLKVMDDPSNYPVLVHCKAGLHRTGVMVAVYRMEYQGWSPAQALREAKANGFAEWVSDGSNDYITQYIMSYQAGQRHSK
jgi:tyrosine-protein phosphatase SIW14